MLARLLYRGDKVYVDQGILKIFPKSGRPVSEPFYKKHQMEMLSDIARLTDQKFYIYESYSTGNYDGGLYPGITLFFTEIPGHEIKHVHFNANLKRMRKTKNGAVGGPLPNGQFRVGKLSAFFKFWIRTSLPFPPRMSAFHDYMGNLKRFVFFGFLSEKNNRIDKSSLNPISVSYEYIFTLFTRNHSDNQQTNHGQHPYKRQTTPPNKDIHNTFINHRIGEDSDTCRNSYDMSNQGNAIHERHIPSIKKKRPEDQTDDEWIADNMSEDDSVPSYPYH